MATIIGLAIAWGYKMGYNPDYTQSVRLNQNVIRTDATTGQILYFASNSFDAEGIPEGGTGQTFEITASVVSASDFLQTDSEDSGSWFGVETPNGTIFYTILVSSSLGSAPSNSPTSLGPDLPQHNYMTASFTPSDTKNADTFHAALNAHVSRSYVEAYSASNSVPRISGSLLANGVNINTHQAGAVSVHYDPELTASYGWTFNVTETGSGDSMGFHTSIDNLIIPSDSASAIMMMNSSGNFEISSSENPIQFTAGNTINLSSENIELSSSATVIHVSSSGKIGLGTNDPLTDVDIRADEFQLQRKAKRKGIKLNTDGNIESFDNEAGGAATGSEVIIRYSRGVSVTKKMLESVLGGTYASDEAAQSVFNALLPGTQMAIIEKAERVGFIEPPQAGDKLGSVRWLTESGSRGDMDGRTSGEAASITATVDSISKTGVQADLSFKVAAEAGAAEQKLLLDANNNHQLTGSFYVSGDIHGDLTGNADTATQLATARTIGGVSFNGTANINLPGVNTAGNQNTTGTANNAKVAAGVTVTSTTSTKSLPVAIVTSTTGDVGVQSNAAFSYQPSTGTLTVSKVAITSINLGGCVISFNTDDGTVNFADAESGKSATITLTGKK